MPKKPLKRLSDQDYKFVFSNAPRICLDFIIIAKGKILLTKRSIPPCKNFWHIPGGRVFYKESIAAASARIINTEIGLKSFNEPQLIGFLEFPQDGKFVHSISLAFIIKISEKDAKKIKIDHQASEYNFFTEAPSKIHAIHKKFLQKQKLLK